ncbi:hypothetical protein DFP72DRAFT_1069422 [Ephemerocybe angulata]|uniref:Uncharacterized protein n=1 Tax=Ephemerocybe angulata TaxID=980116 RepID=A0A8H6M6T4_9AGAR|nr:hypothetical protein DFP72DRAFT_1069422 [Tulosesus angulatus]
MPELQNKGQASSTRSTSRWRTEALLRAAERGSIHHIAKLRDEWPDDLPSAKRAMSILLEQMKTNIASIPDLDRQIELEITEPTVALINACLNSLNGVFKTFGKATKEEAEGLLAIIRPYLEYYLAWLAFLGRRAPSLPGYHSRHNFGAGRIMMLLDRGIHYADDPDTHERVADFCLSLWMVEAASPRIEGAVFTTKGYWECIFVKFDALWRCTAHEPTRNQIVQRVNAFDHANLKLLLSSLYRELFDWPATHMAGYRRNPAAFDCQNLSRYVQTAAMLCDCNPQFFHVMLEMRFATRAYKLAWDLRHGRSAQFCGGSVAGEIANLLFGPMTLLSKESPSLVVELLEAGLLDILAFELLSQPPEGGAQNFDEWLCIGAGLNPLKTLLHFCQYPRVSAAVKAAIDRLPKETQEALSSNAIASRHWKPFFNDFIYYQISLEILEHRAGRLCDSLERIGRLSIGESAQEIEDRRIDQQLSGTWVSHSSRLFKFIHLQVILAKCEWPDLPPGAQIYSPIVIVDATAFPSQNFYMDIADPRLDILDDMKADNRYAAMTRGSVGDPTKLLTVIMAGFGRRRVTALALLSLPHLRLLNGFVREFADESMETSVYYTVHRLPKANQWCSY